MTFSHTYILKGYTNVNQSSSVYISGFQKDKFESIDEDKYRTLEESACVDCITLPICKNKLHDDLIFCPLLDPLFKRILTKLPAKGPGTDIAEYSIIVRLIPLNITTWIIRHSYSYGRIGIIHNGNAEFIYRKFKL